MAFQKGQSGNPAGRPPGTKLLGPIIRRILEEPDARKGTLNHDLIAQRLITMAKAGDLDAIKVVLDRVDGKVAQPISGDPENPTPAFTFTIQRASGENDAR